MLTESVKNLAMDLRESEEYRTFLAAKERVNANEMLAPMLEQYHKLQLTAQAQGLQGIEDTETLSKLQKLGEFLQMDPDASTFLLAEYRVKSLLGSVYKTLANAMDLDLSGIGA